MSGAGYSVAINASKFDPNIIVSADSNVPQKQQNRP